MIRALSIASVLSFVIFSIGLRFAPFSLAVLLGPPAMLLSSLLTPDSVIRCDPLLS